MITGSRRDLNAVLAVPGGDASSAVSIVLYWTSSSLMKEANRRAEFSLRPRDDCATGAILVKQDACFARATTTRIPEFLFFDGCYLPLRPLKIHDPPAQQSRHG